MNLDPTQRRAVSIIRDTISELGLDLSGFEILTEVGSRNYLYTPIIAALAGAKKVNAWTRDSIYGSGDSIKDDCLALAAHLQIAERIHVEVNNRPFNQMGSADMVTNSGFVRPINKTFIDHLKRTAVVPLMYEAWEYRKEDVDGEYCNSRGIRLAGTWEGHPSIKVFEMVGTLCVKLALEAGYEISQNRILIWSDDSFGKEAYRALSLMDPKMIMLTCDVDELMAALPSLDFIFICDYDESRPYFGHGYSVFEISKILSLNDKVGIIHLYGDIDYDLLTRSGLTCFPRKNGKSNVMSETLGYLGLVPILKLQTAGFKVGEALLRNIPTDLKQDITRIP